MILSSPTAETTIKGRSFFQIFILIDFLHYSQTIHLRHENVKQYDVRFFVADDTVDIISVSGLPDQFKRVILFYDVPKHFLHAFVIIRDGNVDLFHKALLCKNS